MPYYYILVPTRMLEYSRFITTHTEPPHHSHTYQFISKRLNVTEFGWNIVEKETYSIFYAIMKLDHLIKRSIFHSTNRLKNFKPYEQRPQR